MTSWKPQNLFRDPDDLVKTVQSILIGETNKNDKSDDGDGLDAVQPKAVKKKFKDRKDKDIDNDGDVDDSDKFLHKRRKAISKSMKEESDIEEAKMPSSMIAKLKKAYEPMRDKKISMNNAKKLTAIMNKFGDDKDMLIQLMKADIPFVSQGAVTRLISKHGMKGAELNKMMKEDVDLEEKTKGMILVADPKTQKVIKIDEKDWPKYEKKGYVQAESNDLDEARIDDVLAVALDNAANKHSPKGRDWGKLTATAAQKLIDKEMEKLGYAMTAGGKWVKEGVYENDVPCAECGKVHEGACAPEDMKEEILDEGKVKYTRNLMKNKSIVDYVKKQQEKNRKNVVKFGNKKVGAFGNEPRFDSGADWLDMASDEVNLSSMSLDKRKAFDAEAEYEAIARKLGLDKFEPKLKEDIVVEAKTVKEDDEDDSDKTDAQKNDMDGDGEKDSKKKKKKKKGDDEDEESSKPDKIDTEPQIKTMVSEREMTEKEKSKLEHLKKNFEGGEMHKSMKTKYGDKGDDVFYGKLTKMAMGEEVSLNIDEAEDGGNENLMMALRKSVSLRGQHQVAFKDGSKVKISQKDAQNLLNRLQKEKPASREAMMKSAYKSEKHFKMALKGKVEPKKNPLDLD